MVVAADARAAVDRALAAAQVGRWTELSPVDRNAAWTPPARGRARAAALRTTARHPSDARSHGLAGARRRSRCWRCVAASLRSDTTRLSATRQRRRRRDAARARRARRQPRRKWRVMPVPDDGSDGPHEFVVEDRGRGATARACRHVPAGAPLARAGRDLRRRRRRSRGGMAALIVRQTAASCASATSLPEDRAGASLDEPRARRARRQGRLGAARPRRRTGTDQGSFGAPLEIEGAHRLDVHLRRHHRCRAAARRTAHRRRDRRRRGRLGAALRLRAGRMGASATGGRHARPHHPDCRRHGLRGAARRRRGVCHDVVEQTALRANALRLGRRADAADVHRPLRQHVALCYWPTCRRRHPCSWLSWASWVLARWAC